MGRRPRFARTGSYVRLPEYLADGKVSSKRPREKKERKTLFLADYLTAFCDAGATSFLLTSTQVRRLQKNVGTNVYKLTGPHRLWFTVSVDEAYCAGLARHTPSARKVSSPLPAPWSLSRRAVCAFA